MDAIRYGYREVVHQFAVWEPVALGGVVSWLLHLQQSKPAIVVKHG